jgi:carbon monoxide dehydrogenase subunit G
VRVEREIPLRASRETVWGFLWDVSRLAGCIPGAKDVRAVEEKKRYTALVGEKVGPFKVEIPLEIQVLETLAPERLRARAGGRDGKVDGLVKVELDLLLTEAGTGTSLRLSADIAVLGKLGTLGHSVIVRRGNEILDRFAAALQAELEKAG